MREDVRFMLPERPPPGPGRGGRPTLLDRAEPVRCWPTTGPAATSTTTTTSGAARSSTSARSTRSVLEGFQSGLSWLTILRKREGFRAPSPTSIEPWRAFGDDDVERLLARRRHRPPPGKIEPRSSTPAPRSTSTTTAHARRAGLALRATRAPAAAAWATCRPRRRSPTRWPRSSSATASLRRPDDDVRAHAVLRARQRPPRGLLGARRGAGRAGLSGSPARVARRGPRRRARPGAGGGAARGRACGRGAWASGRSARRRSRRPARGPSDSSANAKAGATSLTARRARRPRCSRATHPRRRGARRTPARALPSSSGAQRTLVFARTRIPRRARDGRVARTGGA